MGRCSDVTEGELDTQMVRHDGVRTRWADGQM